MAYTAKAYADESHKLTTPPNAQGEIIFSTIYQDIYDFVYDHEKQEARPLFTHELQMDVCKSVLNQFSEEAVQESNMFRIMNICDLLYLLKKASSKSGQNAEGFQTIYVAEAMIERDQYEFHLNLGCETHEELDATKYCSLSQVRRWSYTVCDHCCVDLGISLIPGKHIPIETALPEVKIEEPEPEDYDDDRDRDRDRKYYKYSSYSSRSKKLSLSDYGGYSKNDREPVKIKQEKEDDGYGFGNRDRFASSSSQFQDTNFDPTIKIKQEFGDDNVQEQKGRFHDESPDRFNNTDRDRFDDKSRDPFDNRPRQDNTFGSSSRDHFDNKSNDRFQSDLRNVISSNRTFKYGSSYNRRDRSRSRDREWNRRRRSPTPDWDNPTRSPSRERYGSYSRRSRSRERMRRRRSSSSDWDKPKRSPSSDWDKKDKRSSSRDRQYRRRRSYSRDRDYGKNKTVYVRDSDEDSNNSRERFYNQVYREYNRTNVQDARSGVNRIKKEPSEDSSDRNKWSRNDRVPDKNYITIKKEPDFY